MPTSGSVDFSVTRDDILDEAHILIGVLDPEGGALTATQKSNASRALNLMVKTWQADGLQLWANKKSSFAITSGQASYTVSALTINRPLRILQAFLRNTTSNTDTPIKIITQDEYYGLGSKTSTGTPTLLYYDPQLTNALSTIYLYPTPDASSASNYQVHILYSRPFEDFDAASDTPDFPQEWYEAVIYGLALRLAPRYGIPTEKRNMIAQDFESIKRQAMNFDQEYGSVYFQPEN